MNRTFYVSPTGSDSHTGSRAQPFKSIKRVNSQILAPGDSVLFQAEASFPGTLLPQQSGAAAQPIRYGSYPKGRGATIVAGDGSAIHVRRPLAHVTFENLILAGDWATHSDSGTSAAIGVHFENPHHYSHITLDGLDVSRFGSHGILVWGSSDHFSILRCESHHNRHDGIVLRPLNWITIGHRNARIAHCAAYHNSGLSTLTAEHSGSGILAGGVDKGVVEKCFAHNNGLRGASLSGGPVGIWTWMSNRLSIRLCESHHNGNAGPNDGGGFDIDGSCTHCEIRECYSHDNEGPGFLVAAYPGSSPMADNAIHHCLSLYDCTKPSRGGSLDIWNGQSDASAMVRTSIHHNTFVAIHEALHTYGTPSAGTSIHHNRFSVPRGRRMMTLPVTGEDFEMGENTYYTQGGELEFELHHDLHGSLAALRKAGFEKKGAHAKGRMDVPGEAPTFEDAGKMAGFLRKWV